MFGIEDDPDDPTVVHPHAVRIIGNGTLNAGQRCSKALCQWSAGNPALALPSCTTGRHDDDDHGWRVGR